MTYNAARRKDVREAEKLAKTADAERRQIVSGLMQVKQGRKWMCDLLEFCSIFSTSFHFNPGVVAFNEGKRTVGLRLLEDLMAACPDSYVLMMKERNQHERARNNSSDRRDANDASAGGFSVPSEYAGSTDPVGGTEDGTEPEPDDAGGWQDSVYGAYAARRKPS